MKRNSFGIVFAIFVLLLISTVSIYMLQFANTGSKESVDDFVRIQSKLYEDSAVEWAILQLQGSSAPSLQTTLNISFGTGYAYAILITPLIGDSSIQESNGTVLLDVVGTITVLGAEAGNAMRTHKRLLVKP